MSQTQAVYALDKRGADVVAATYGIDRHKINWKRDHNRVEFLFMEHTLAVSDFRVNLDLALAESAGSQLLFYQRADKTLQARVADPSGKKKYLVVAPDAFFGIKTDKGSSYFFVEVDMGTETLKRFAEKVIAYKQYWKSGKYTERYGYNHFRVLIIANSERRLVNLVEATTKAGAKNMFLFTTFAGIYKSILGPVWFSPVSPDPNSLLE